MSSGVCDIRFGLAVNPANECWMRARAGIVTLQRRLVLTVVNEFAVDQYNRQNKPTLFKCGPHQRCGTIVLDGPITVRKTSTLPSLVMELCDNNSEEISLQLEYN
jgi:hypothetical protein